MTTLGTKIRKLREAKKLTQAELAKCISVAQGSVGNWEAGIRTEIRGATLLKLAKALEVEPSELLASTTPNIETVDRSEIGLLTEFRALTEEQKQLALRLVEAINK